MTPTELRDAKGHCLLPDGTKVQMGWITLDESHATVGITSPEYAISDLRPVKVEPERVYVFENCAGNRWASTDDRSLVGELIGTLDMQQMTKPGELSEVELQQRRYVWWQSKDGLWHWQRIGDGDGSAFRATTRAAAIDAARAHATKGTP